MSASGEKWLPRGLGKEWNLSCFVSGDVTDRAGLKDNISGFVEDRAAGERVVALFGGHARLDYRPSEPNWIQVKVGVRPEFVPALERLQDLVRANGDVVTTEIIEEAKKAPALNI